MTDISAASAPRRENGQFIILPSEMRARTWQKGQSGNPGGKGGDYKALQAYCREKSLASAERIAQIAESTKDERLAFMAYCWLVERGWGKPKDYDPKDELSEGSTMSAADMTLARSSGSNAVTGSPAMSQNLVAVVPGRTT
jgi:hypothetical protein